METKKQICLVAINSRTSHTNPALYYIKKILKKDRRVECRLIELTINENWKPSLEKICADPCDIYMFSVYIWNTRCIEELVPLLKQIKPESRIILGGPEITYNIKKWKALNIADVLVQGQAEAFLPLLPDYDQQVFHSPNTPINNVPFPYDSEDYDNLQNRLVYYEASRGCFFNCSYCLSSCSDQRLEYRDLETVKEELKTLIKIKPKIVKMVDRTFNSDKQYAREIWNFIIEERSPIPFHFELHPLFLDEEDFVILETAPEGLFHFEVGIQSTNKKILEAVNRPYNWPKEKENIKRLCTLKNIHTHLDQIVALPLDTAETAIQSFNEILSLKPDEFQLGFLKILPGTALSKSLEKYVMIATSTPPYEVVQTSTMNYSSMRQFYKMETDLGRFYNSHYFIRSLGFLISLSSDPWTFFSELQEFSPLDRTVKQWARLGESLLSYTEKHHSDLRDYLFDLLRLDWCPFASGQNFPPFLRREDGEDIKEKRRKCYAIVSGEITGFTRRDFNHSLLFVPSSGKLIKDLDHKAVLFYRTDSIRQYTIDLNLL